MQSTHTFSVDVVIRRCKSDRSVGQLFLRITVDGLPREISLKEKIPVISWDSKSEKVEGKTKEVKSLNEAIEHARVAIKNLYRDFNNQGSLITAQIIKDSYEGRTRKFKGHTLLGLIAYHDKIMKPKLKAGTIKNYAATEAYLKNYVGFKYKAKDLHLTELNYEFILEFEHYVPRHPLKVNDPCEGNGTVKHIERIKKMVSWAKLLGWIPTNPFEGFSASRKKNRRKKLTLQELVNIERLALIHPSIIFTRDLFLFSCYTGLAYADVMALRKHHIEREGKFAMLQIHREKSEELSAVPLFDSALRIVNKYTDDPRVAGTDRILPYVTNQEINRNLKIIVAAAGIMKYVSFHTARHTFAKEVTLKSGVPIETVQKMLGHKKITTTQIYTEVDEEKIKDDMDGVEEVVRLRKSRLAKSL